MLCRWKSIDCREGKSIGEHGEHGEQASNMAKGDLPVTTYEELIKEVRSKYDAFGLMTAKKYVPKLWEALKNENPSLSREELRERLERDCLEFWSERRILETLPDEAKHPEKQKIGRLGRKNKISAAVSAAPFASNRKEIVIDVGGRPIENNSASPQYSYGKGGQLDDNDNNKREDHLTLEFSIPTSDILPIIIILREDRIWFDVVFDKSTAQIVSAAIAEKTRLQLTDGIQVIDENESDTHKT
jgi:hypothetical protein